MKERLNLALKGVIVVTLYFCLSTFQALPFSLLNIDLEKVPIILKEAYLILSELMLIVIIFIIFEKQAKAGIEDLKKNHLTYFKKYIKFYILAVVVMLVSNFCLFFANDGNIAGNEQAIRDIFNQRPIYIFISAVLLAPLLEELTFRVGLRNILGNNWFFVIASGLIFGGLHLIGTYQGVSDLLYIIPYGSFGVAFAYMLMKTNNIFVSMGFHFLHNGIIMAFQFITIIFG